MTKLVKRSAAPRPTPSETMEERDLRVNGDPEHTYSKGGRRVVTMGNYE